MDELINNLPEILQPSYFRVNPLNPNNTEDNYQEVFRENLTIKLNKRIGSEITVQKSAKDILGEEIPLKNKTERYDLTMDNILFELKNVEKLEKIHDYQLLSYLDGSDYKYGVLINFAKSKNFKNCIVHCKIYEKDELVEKTDEFGYKYQQHKFKLIKEFKSQNYLEFMGEYEITDTNVINIEP
tara:strand:+ start:81 stop:632 length:552 start_codon:yes stop_codon:yes gene_type:complete